MPETTPSVPPRIFEHTSRKDWGRSVLLLEIPDKRTFLFEDGAERSFRPDYWHKMEIIEVLVNEAVRIDRLARRNQAPAPGSTRKSKAPPKKPASPAIHHPPGPFPKDRAEFGGAFPWRIIIAAIATKTATRCRYDASMPSCLSAARFTASGFSMNSTDR